jgi:hypothetical protein
LSPFGARRDIKRLASSATELALVLNAISKR